jgi:hypothetical protein
VTPAGWASQTQHSVDADTGAERWAVETPGLQVSLTQILPDQSLAFFLARGFPRAAAERYAAACVFMTIVRNPGSAAADVDLRGWRVAGTPGVERLHTKEEWMTFWKEQGLGEAERIAFEWSQFPTAQSFEPGDWNQGMATVLAQPGTRFDLEIRWRSEGDCRTATLVGVRCAAR